MLNSKVCQIANFSRFLLPQCIFRFSLFVSLYKWDRRLSETSQAKQSKNFISTKIVSTEIFIMAVTIVIIHCDRKKQKKSWSKKHNWRHFSCWLLIMTMSRQFFRFCFRNLTIITLRFLDSFLKKKILVFFGGFFYICWFGHAIHQPRSIDWFRFRFLRIFFEGEYFI